MLNEFEKGKKYRVKTLEELKKLMRPENHPYQKLVLDTIDKKLGGLKFICDRNPYPNYIYQFKGEFIYPWMCEEIKIEVDDISQTSSNFTKIVKHNEICKNLNNLYKSKNHDYGDSFGETFKKLGVISAITRITDKVNRLQSLATKDALVDESIKDTLMDLANYSIMTIIELELEGEKE